MGFYIKWVAFICVSFAMPLFILLITFLKYLRNSIQCFNWWILDSVCSAENIIREAINSSSKEMGEAKRLLLRIISRQIYKCLGKMQSEKPTMVCSNLLCFWASLHFLTVAMSMHIFNCLRVKNWILLLEFC